MELYDSAENKVFGWTSKLNYDNYTVTYDDITTNNELYVSADFFSDYVDGEVTWIRKKTSDNIWGWSDSFRYEGEESIVEVKYLPNMETAYTVNANQYAIYVDPSFGGRTFETYLEVGDTKYSVNNYAGIKTFNSTVGSYQVMIGLDSASGGGSGSVVTVSSGATEYIKYKVKLSQLSSEFSDDGTYIDDDDTYSLKSDTDDKAFRIVFFSGAFISLLVPDENGYVEIYVDKSTRKFSWDKQYVNGMSSGGGGGSSDTAHMITEFTIPSVEAPEDGLNIYNIPAGTYTLKVSGVPYGYVAPEEQTITISDSDEFNYATIKLHLHEYGIEYEKDETGHWYECECGDKSGFASHVSSGEATEFEAEVCTECGYLITPALGHEYGTEYEKDETSHWYECECGDKSNIEEHEFEWIIDKEAEVGVNGSKHEECVVCGYKKEAELIPALPEDTPEETTGDTPEETTGNTSEETIGETPKETTVKSTDKQETTVAPTTGDNSLVAIIVLAVMLSAGVMVIVLGKRKITE